MKNTILFSTMAVWMGSFAMAQAAPKDDVTSAVQKLAAEPSYSWHTAVVVPEDSQFKPGPTEGKTVKGDVTYVKMSFGDNDTEIYMKGTNAAVTNPDGGWQSLADMQGDDQGPGRFMVRMVQNFKTPDAQATQLISAAKDLELNSNAYTSDLTADGAKDLLSFRRGGNASVTNPSGSVMFWVSNGELTKYEFKVKGSVSFNDNDIDIDRDTTVEFSNVGATKIEVPADAKTKMQ